MIIGKKTQVATDFKPSINHILIRQTDNFKISWNLLGQ